MTEIVVSEHLPGAQRVRLRSAGFESCLVRCPSWKVDRSLRWFYRTAARVSACAFVNELLANCIVPARRPREVAALPQRDRARLRVALVAVHDLKREWRALDGSHLTPDERLLAVMVWRYQELERVRVRLVDYDRELTATSEATAAALTEWAAVPAGALGLGATSLTETARRSLLNFTGLTPVLPDYSKLLTPLPDYSQSVVTQLAKTVSAGVGLGPSSLALGRTSALAGFAFKSQPILAALGLGEQSGLQSVHKIVSGLLGARSAPLVVGALAPQRGVVSQLSLNLPRMLGFCSGAELARMYPTPIIDAGKMFRSYIEPLRELAEAMQETGRFMLRWEREALWYLLSLLGPGAAHRLVNLDESEVEEAVLYALEAVVADGEFVPALRAAVASAPHLGRSQRIHLDHMLEHAAAGAYVHASAPLYPGLEGAFWEVAYARAVVTAERTRLDNPNRKVGFETVVKQLGLEQEFQTFMVRAVFGTAGNPFRHGGASSGERRQVLFGIAALAGWLEQFANQPALEVLGACMATVLPPAIDRVQRPALQAGI